MQPPFIDLRIPTRSAYGIPKASVDFSLYHGMFTFDVPESMWFVYENGVQIPNSTSTGATSEDGMLKVTSQGNNTRVESRRHPRYQPNRGHYYGSSIILPDVEADGIREWGCSTQENGIFFRLESGVLYSVRRSLGIDYPEEIKLPTGADISKGCLYDSQMMWRGVGHIEYFVSHNKGTTVKHLDLLGTQSALIIANPATSMWFKAEKKTEDVTLYCGCVDLTSEGGNKEREQYVSATASVAAVSAPDPVIAIRQPLLIKGKQNTRDARLARVRITSDKKSDFGLYITRDPTAITSIDWSAVPGSYIEEALDGEITDYDTTKMRKITTLHVAAGLLTEITNPSPDTIDFFVVHGEYVFVDIEAGVNVTATITIELGEEV